MPRKRDKKTSRGSKDLLLYEQAYEEIIKGRSIRASAKMFDLCHISLLRYRNKKIGAPDSRPNMGYNPATKVFTEEQENCMAKYVIKTADIYYGLSPKEVRRLAYDLAVKYNIEKPESWERNRTAGADWFSGFMRRNPELSIRCAQATSLSRATSFNRTNVDAFFDNLEKVMTRDSFEPHKIYNMDETGITTVQKPDRIVTRKGTRQVGALTSGERGTLVTMAAAVNALGNAMPPFFVFPRIRYQSHFVRDGPPGCVGAGNSSGWMEEAQFLEFLRHFHHHVESSRDSKVLLLLDNHTSHISIKALDYCKENGIVVLSFPPHCSHKLQPLDRSVYGPLKKFVNTGCDAWMRSHPGQTMSIYDIPSVVASAFPLAFTPRNIQAGFRVAGIYPYNRNIFDDSDFGPSFVTDRPLANEFGTSQGSEGSSTSFPQEQETVYVREYSPEVTPSLPSHPVNNNLEITIARSQTPPYQKSPSILDLDKPSTSNVVENIFSPEEARPLPKAPPRKKENRGRKTRASTIYTDTPEKDAIQQEVENRETKKRATEAKKNLTALDKGKGKGKKTKINTKVAKDIEAEDEDEDDENTETKKKYTEVKKNLNLVEKGKGKGKKSEKNTKVTKQKPKKSTNKENENEDYSCLVCGEPYLKSKANEIWVQCQNCLLWAHEKCTAQELSYICDNCE